jgi:hypothetical protein
VARGTGAGRSRTGNHRRAYAAYTQDFGFTTIHTVLNLPIALRGMVLVIWLLTRHSNPRTSTPDPTTSSPRLD